ncbi:APC family permease [Acidisoma sp. 7E03]
MHYTGGNDAHPLPIDEPVTLHLAKNKLGALAIAFFVIAAAAPMAAVIGASPVIFSAVGPAAPLTYIMAAILIGLFAVGYLRMSLQITNAGGFVAYIAKGIGNKWATAGAGLAILTYLALQVGLWAQFGVFAQVLIATLGGANTPPLLWIVLFIVFVTLLTAQGVDASLKLLGALIVLETAIIAILLVAIVAHHGLSVFSIAGFTAKNLFGSGLGVALLFAFLCFTAFEATVVFSEEARDPRRTIPRALYIAIAFVAAFYGISTWVIGGAVGIDAIRETATKNPANFIFDLAKTNAGNLLALSMQVLVVTSFVAMMLGLANMFARYLFALGRAGVLSTRLAAVSAKGAPSVAAIVNGVVTGLIVAAWLLAGADPIAVVFAWFTALGTASFISILILTSISIVVFFLQAGVPDGWWSNVIAPVLSVVGFVYVGFLTLSNYTLLSGSGGTATWLLVAVPVFLLGGWARGAAKKSIDYGAQMF